MAGDIWQIFLKYGAFSPSVMVLFMHLKELFSVVSTENQIQSKSAQQANNATNPLY